MAELNLNNGFKTIFDDEDAERVAKYKWYASKHNDRYYVIARFMINRVTTKLFLHRYLMDVTDRKIKVDHRFGDTMDNRKSQLRACTHAENQRNGKKHVDGKGPFKGVTQTLDGKKWNAAICFNGEKINIGNFKTPEDAARAYNFKAKELFKEFALLNIVEDGPVPIPEKLKSGNTSGYNGIYFHNQRKKWHASIEAGGKKYSLGLHWTKENAARAFDAKAIELFGPTYSKLNFPIQTPTI
jgi:hypothetical protein